METKDPRDSRPKDLNTNAAAEPTPKVTTPSTPGRTATGMPTGAQATPSQMQDPPPVKRRKKEPVVKTERSTGEQIQEATEAAGEQIQEATEAAGEQIQEASKAAGEQIQEATESVKEKVSEIDFKEHLGPLLNAWKRFFSPQSLSFTQVRLNTTTNIIIAVVTILFTALTLPLIQQSKFDTFFTGAVFSEGGLVNFSYGRAFGLTLLYSIILYAIAFVLTYFFANIAKDPYNSSLVALERVNYGLFPYMTLLPIAFIFAFFAPVVASFLMVFGLLYSLLVYAHLWLKSTEQQRDRRFGLLLGILAILLIVAFLFFRMNII